MGKIFSGGNNWWIQCSLLLTTLRNSCASASCNNPDKRWHGVASGHPKKTSCHPSSHPKWKYELWYLVYTLYIWKLLVPPLAHPTPPLEPPQIQMCRTATEQDCFRRTFSQCAMLSAVSLNTASDCRRLSDYRPTMSYYWTYRLLTVSVSWLSSVDSAYSAESTDGTLTKSATKQSSFNTPIVR